MSSRLHIVSADPFMENTALVVARFIAGRAVEPTIGLVNTHEGQKRIKILRSVVERKSRRKSGIAKSAVSPLYRCVIPMPDFPLRTLIGMTLEFPD